jgi:hypothetical protein
VAVDVLDGAAVDELVSVVVLVVAAGAVVVVVVLESDCAQAAPTIATRAAEAAVATNFFWKLRMLFSRLSCGVWPHPKARSREPNSGNGDATSVKKQCVANGATRRERIRLECGPSRWRCRIKA